MADTQDVRIERTFDAPIEVVWAMWTEPDHFAHWYGPMGATVPSADMDVRVGGRRRITMEMQGPDGPMQMHFVGEYRHVEPMTRLEYSEVMADADGNPLTPEQAGMPAGTPAETSVIVELTDLDGSTNMVMTHVGVAGDSPGAQGWSMAFDKLQARLEGERTQ